MMGDLPSGVDGRLHMIADDIKGLLFRPVPIPDWRKGTVAEYYYCEERLYLLRFEDGTFTFSCGSDPYDAWHKWLLRYERKLEKEVTE